MQSVTLSCGKWRYLKGNNPIGGANFFDFHDSGRKDTVHKVNDWKADLDQITASQGGLEPAASEVTQIHNVINSYWVNPWYIKNLWDSFHQFF